MALPDPLAEKILAISKQAGDKIMEIYEKDFAIYEKEDTSPLTEADLAAHKVIVAGLEAVSHLPILSEESADIPWDERRGWDKYWLVDPLDGTKEFIKKNGEFTVNIALIENGKPVMVWFSRLPLNVLTWVLMVRVRGWSPMANSLQFPRRNTQTVKSGKW